MADHVDRVGPEAIKVCENIGREIGVAVFCRVW